VRLLRPGGGYWKVAHRGASALAPENSLAALEAALDARVDIVELDVLPVAGELRLAHSLGQLRPDNPGLDEALAVFAAKAPSKTLLDLDVKLPGLEPALVEALRAHGVAARTLVTSFYPAILQSVRTLEPTVTLGVSYPNDRFGLSGQRALAPFVGPGLRFLRILLPHRIARMVVAAGAEAAMLHHALVSRRVVERCHASGAAVFAWTVEEPADLVRVLAAGVDGVIANDPSLFSD
jgi:glycerophosphoryl diester phosphodiesterase